MKMIRGALVAGLAVAFFVSTTAQAQMAELETLGRTTPEQRADFLTQTMASELMLLPDQVQGVQALNLMYSTLQQPLLEKTGVSLSRVHQIKKLNSQKESALRDLLSDEQWAAYEKGRDALKQQLESWAEKQTVTPSP